MSAWIPWRKHKHQFWPKPVSFSVSFTFTSVFTHSSVKKRRIRSRERWARTAVTSPSPWSSSRANRRKTSASMPSYRSEYAGLIILFVSSFIVILMLKCLYCRRQRATVIVADCSWKTLFLWRRYDSQSIRFCWRISPNTQVQQPLLYSAHIWIPIILKNACYTCYLVWH